MDDHLAEANRQVQEAIELLKRRIEAPEVWLVKGYERDMDDDIPHVLAVASSAEQADELMNEAKAQTETYIYSADPEGRRHEHEMWENVSIDGPIAIGQLLPEARSKLHDQHKRS